MSSSQTTNTPSSSHLGLEATLFSLQLDQLPSNFPELVYSALCNRGWRRIDAEAHPVSERAYTCSWRHAGAVAADLAAGPQGEGNYMEYYCSGNEGVVDQTVEDTLNARGWQSCSYDEACAWMDPDAAAGHIACHELEEYLQETYPGQGFVRVSGKDARIRYETLGENKQCFWVDRETGTSYQEQDGKEQVVLQAPDISRFQKETPQS